MGVSQNFKSRSRAFSSSLLLVMNQHAKFERFSSDRFPDMEGVQRFEK